MILSVIVRYSSNLTDAMHFGRRKGMVSGGGMGLVMFIIFVVYCVIFWYGCKLVREDFGKEDAVYTPGNMLIVSTTTCLRLKFNASKSAFVICAVQDNGIPPPPTYLASVYEHDSIVSWQQT